MTNLLHTFEIVRIFLSLQRMLPGFRVDYRRDGLVQSIAMRFAIGERKFGANIAIDDGMPANELTPLVSRWAEKLIATYVMESTSLDSEALNRAICRALDRFRDDDAAAITGG